MQAKSIAFVGEPFGLTDHSPSDTKKTLKPLTQRRQRPFYIGLFGSQGELRAYDRVTMNVPVYTER